MLAAVVAGTVLASFVIARYGDRWGRRRSYRGLYGLLALTGVVFASAERWWLLADVALLRRDVDRGVESGPFTTLEQAMLATDLRATSWRGGSALQRGRGRRPDRSARWPLAGIGPLRRVWNGRHPTNTGSFCVGPGRRHRDGARAVADRRRWNPTASTRAQLRSTLFGPSRPVVVRLAGLFAVDSFAGGFTVSAFIAYWFAHRFDTSDGVIGASSSPSGVLQTLSFLSSGASLSGSGCCRPWWSPTCRPTSCSIAVAFAPTSTVAVALLFARVALSQMDVPTRQAYVMALVPPAERTAAASATNSARYVTRPGGPGAWRVPHSRSRSASRS